MNWKDVPKPPGIAALPVDERGYPIFYTIQPPPGLPLNFRALNLEHHNNCATHRLCGICGFRLGLWLWFVGGPMCLANRIFGDAPMHLECAHYARKDVEQHYCGHCHQFHEEIYQEQSE